MKLTVTGIEVSEGKSKAGKDYAIGTLHCIEKLAAPFGSKDNIAKGFAGSKFECPINILRAMAHLPFPIEAEVTTENVLKFGNREQVVVDCVPIAMVKKVA